MNIQEIEDAYGIGFCRRQPVVIENGKGSYVWDEAGNRYLDFTSGWGVTCLGHCHPVLLKALHTQAEKIFQNPNSGFTYSPARARLMLELSKQLPLGLTQMFFVNSGAEANDAALKFARKISGRPGIVATKNGFHGRTQSTFGVSVNAESASRFPPLSAHNRFVEYGDIDAMAAALDERIAAVIVEPIQGEGGVRVPEADYLGKVRALCHRHKALLIVDEIQTGFCRTGKMFALQHCVPSVQPDILTMGKGLAGGFPFAGIAVTEAVAAQLQPGDHGGTFAGNPLGSALATAVIRYLREHKVAERARKQGDKLQARLQALAVEFPQFVRQVRGRGLLWALQLADDDAVARLSSACLSRGLLVTPTRNAVVRLLPSLLVSDREIDVALAILRAALSATVRDCDFGLDCGVQARRVD